VGDTPTFGPCFTLSPTAANDSGADFDVSVASDGSGTWMAVWSGASNDSDIRVARSFDGGRTWTPAELLHPSLASDTGDDDTPRIATDGAGTWVVVWQSDEPVGPGDTDLDVLVSRSTDGGDTWSAPAPIFSGAANDSVMDLAPHVASDGLGTWVAVWQSSDPQPSPYTDFDIWTARSIDAGATWSAPMRVDAASGSDLRSDTEPVIAADGAGNWVATWNADELADNLDTDLDVLVARSGDGGLSWSAPVLLNPHQGPGRRDDFDARVAGDGAGNWVAVWASNDPMNTLGEDFDILTARSADGGLTWTSPALLNRSGPIDAGADFDPQIGHDREGHFMAVWQSNDGLGGTGSDSDVLLAVSGDGGATWSTPRVPHAGFIGDDTPDFDPQLATDGSGTWLMLSYGPSGPGGDLDVAGARGTAPFGPARPIAAQAANDSGADWTPRVLAESGAWLVLWTSTDPLSSGIGTDADIVLARSSDGGTTWSDPAPLDAAAANDSGADLEPALAGDGAGNVVAVWSSTESLGGTGPDADIRFSRSSDGGVQWTPAAPLQDNAANDSGSDTSPQVASGGAGTWLAVWTSDDAAGGIGTDADVLFARSSDDGASWTSPAPLHASAANDSGTDQAPQIASDGAGAWVAIWESSEPGSDADILAATSSDGGATWSAPAAVNAGAANDSAADRAPQIASDGLGHWLAVWQSDDPTGGIGTDLDILAATSSDGGATWSDPAPVDANAANDSGSDSNPWIATDGTGLWVVIWQSDEPLDGLGSDADLLVARSEDGGATWSAPVRANSDAASDSGDDVDPALASDRAGAWLVTWGSTDPLGGSIGAEPDVLVAVGVGRDRDSDGLSDAAEINLYGSDPDSPDSEADGLPDGDEVILYGSDPVANDSDLDQIGDWEEVFLYGSAPTSVDTDADTLGDWDEIFLYGTDPASNDSDDDLLDDPSELLYGTDPNESDGDDDGLEDGWEILVYGTDPFDRDSDNDLLDDEAEVNDYHTNPLEPDSDGDTASDFMEVVAGSDPNDNLSWPWSVPAVGVRGLVGLGLALLLAGRPTLRRGPSASAGR
jgi:hypothetical protein